MVMTSLSFVNLYDEVCLSKQWRKCAKKIEMICLQFIKTKRMDEPHLQCLLHILGPHFASTYFPNQKLLSYYYLKQPFLDKQQLKELQQMLLSDLKAFIAESIQRDPSFTIECKQHLSQFAASQIPSVENQNSKDDINDAVSTILSLDSRYLTKLDRLRGTELSGSLRAFVWLHHLRRDEEKMKMMNVKNSNDIRRLIDRILTTSRRNMEGLGYSDLDDIHRLKQIENTLNAFYLRFERYSYRISMMAIHLHCSLNQYVGGETEMVPILNDLITHKIWDTAKCKIESAYTVKSLSQREDTKELYHRLSSCYQNISRNVNLLESQSKINNQEKIPLTLQSMIHEFYFHGLVGYLRSESVGYIWDQLFLYDDWCRLKEITIRLLAHSNLTTKMMENEVEDAVNLYRVVRAHLKSLRIVDLKKCIPIENE